MNEKRLASVPGMTWAMRHPRLAAWAVLSVGMIILLVLSAIDVGLLPMQWVMLMLACVLVAGACVWIISWEGDDDDEDEAPAAVVTPVEPAAVIETPAEPTVTVTETPAEPPTT